MEKIKIMPIFGTRPEAIKMLPLVNELKKRTEVEVTVCVTAQHRQMLDQVFHIYNQVPDIDLDIMKDKQTLTDITTNALKGLDAVIKQAKPHIILVHGDTTTTFAGSLAAYYNQVKIGHVEAGLRTYNKYEPFPEEMNRKLTGAMADLHFAPTPQARDNLLKEGVSGDRIFVTGNTAIDGIKSTVEENYVFTQDILNQINYQNKKIIAVTAHRRENLGENLENICNAILKIVSENTDVQAVYAVHKNPLVEETVYRLLGNSQDVFLTEPLDLKDMHNLINNAYIVLTDSGGIQEEAPYLNKPVLVLRNVTERPEGIETGALKLVGVLEKDIYQTARLFLTDTQQYEKTAKAINPFGDGLASKRIADAILFDFGIKKEKPKEFYPG